MTVVIDERENSQKINEMSSLEEAKNCLLRLHEQITMLRAMLCSANKVKVLLTGDNTEKTIVWDRRDLSYKWIKEERRNDGDITDNVNICIFGDSGMGYQATE